jgi:hypothetical protein
MRLTIGDGTDRSTKLRDVRPGSEDLVADDVLVTGQKAGGEGLATHSPVGLAERARLRWGKKINFVSEFFPSFLMYFKCRFGRRGRT